MGHDQAVVLKPESPVEAELADAVDKVVAAIDAGTARVRTRHTIASVLMAYDFMRKHSGYARSEAAAVISVAADCGGLVTWNKGVDVVAMMAMWPTDNPNIARRLKLPPLVYEGAYVYVDWAFGTGDWKDIRRGLSYGAEKFEKTAFICAHEGRRRGRGNAARGSGKLVVRRIRRAIPTINRLLELPHG